MAITHSYGVTWTGVGGDPVTLTTQVAADTAVIMSFTVPAGATNQEQQVGFDVANLKGLIITTTKAVTLKTNSTSVPAHTLTFADAGHLNWDAKSPQTNPFGATDLTTTFWTNAGTADAAVEFRATLDS